MYSAQTPRHCYAIAGNPVQQQTCGGLFESYRNSLDVPRGLHKFLLNSPAIRTGFDPHAPTVKKQHVRGEVPEWWVCALYITICTYLLDLAIHFCWWTELPAMALWCCDAIAGNPVHQHMFWGWIESCPQQPWCPIVLPSPSTQQPPPRGLGLFSILGLCSYQRICGEVTEMGSLCVIHSCTHSPINPCNTLLLMHRIASYSIMMSWCHSLQSCVSTLWPIRRKATKSP